MITDWFRPRSDLIRARDDDRKNLSRALRRLAVAKHRIRSLEAEVKAQKLLVACTAPAEHLRLAARAERAESLLAQRESRQPHLASLRPVPFDPEAS